MGWEKRYGGIVAAVFSLILSATKKREGRSRMREGAALRAQGAHDSIQKVVAKERLTEAPLATYFLVASVKASKTEHPTAKEVSSLQLGVCC